MKNRRGVLHGIRIFQADFREDPAMFKRGRKMKRLNVLLLSGAMLLTTAAVTGVTAPKTASVGDLIVTGEAEGNRDYAKVKRAGYDGKRTDGGRLSVRCQGAGNR